MEIIFVSVSISVYENVTVQHPPINQLLLL